WRNEYDAIAIGISTLLLDDPALTTRLPGGRTPLKVVFDSVARTPTTAKLFEPDPPGEPARVLVFVIEDAPATRVERLREPGAAGPGGRGSGKGCHAGRPTAGVGAGRTP